MKIVKVQFNSSNTLYTYKVIDESMDIGIGDYAVIANSFNEYKIAKIVEVSSVNSDYKLFDITGKEIQLRYIVTVIPKIQIFNYLKFIKENENG